MLYYTPRARDHALTLLLRRRAGSEPGFDTIAGRPPWTKPLTVLAAVKTANSQVVGRSTGDDERVRFAHSRFPVGLRLYRIIFIRDETMRVKIVNLLIIIRIIIIRL